MRQQLLSSRLQGNKTVFCSPWEDFLSKTEVLNCTFHRRGVVGVGGGAGVGGREFEFSLSMEIRTGRSKRVTYPQSSARIVEQKRRFEWVPQILKAELSTTQPVFVTGHKQQHCFGSESSVPREEHCTSSTLGFLFGVVPPRRGVITVTVTFFVLSHRRKKMQSLFFPPSSSFFPLSPSLHPRVHGVNCVHFNYDLISE